MSALFQNNPDLDLSAKITVGTEAANAINVAIQFLDRRNGADLGEAVAVPCFLSTTATGTALSTAPSGGIAIGTDGLLIEWTANLAGLLISESDGDADITITEESTGTWYLILVMPNGRLVASPAITFA
jgi:hypothetical protein